MLNSFLAELSPCITYDKDAKCPAYNGTPFSETDPEWDEVYPKMQALEEFHRFFHEDDVLDLMKTVSGASTSAKAPESDCA